jgi:hypothetical protein
VIYNPFTKLKYIVFYQYTMNNTPELNEPLNNNPESQSDDLLIDELLIEYPEFEDSILLFDADLDEIGRICDEELLVDENY